MALRFQEAARLGFEHIICAPTQLKPPAGCKLIPVPTLSDALQHLA
jgi:predicted ATP-dependent serine protease